MAFKRKGKSRVEKKKKKTKKSIEDRAYIYLRGCDQYNCRSGERYINIGMGRTQYVQVKKEKKKKGKKYKFEFSYKHCCSLVIAEWRKRGILDMDEDNFELV